MTTPTIKLDHLVVAATSLEIGMAWVKDRIGVDVPRAGAHNHMATHNCVGRIGDDIYLEIIAINPDDTPDRIRWFSMDDPTFQARLTRKGAFLHHWAVNTSDISTTLHAARHTPGDAMAMSRGTLHWKISVRDDGILARDGVIPTVIEWPDIPHPSQQMTDLGIRFEEIAVHTTDPAGTRADLEAIGATHLCQVVEADKNTLSATFTRDGKIIGL